MFPHEIVGATIHSSLYKQYQGVCQFSHAWVLVEQNATPIPRAYFLVLANASSSSVTTLVVTELAVLVSRGRCI